MKVIITKQQYKNLAFSVLENIVGDLKLDSEDYQQGDAYIKVYDSYGENIMDIWFKTSAIPKGCKKELNVNYSASELIFNYLPLVRKKIFSEVFLEYFYMKTNYKCDCVTFPYPTKEKDSDNDFVYRSFEYKKKKKKLKESVIKEDNLKTILLDAIETDGWEDTAELVGGYENLLSIVGEDKIIPLLISCFYDLNIKSGGNDIILRDNHLPLLEMQYSPYGPEVRVFNDNIRFRLELKLGPDIITPYVKVRREFIMELINRFPVLTARRIEIFKDKGLYPKLDSFML
jgi:hypothetical protein